jgi:putative S-methylcysteine transport system substrate-binding protein
MTDDRLRRWLEAAEEPLAPDPRFAAALRDELRHELGFIPADQARRSSLGLHRAGRRRPNPARLLLAAALLVGGAVGLVALAGSLVDQSPEPRQDALAEIEALGRIRVAIRPDHPQVSTLGQPAAGFDIDVAEALAEQMQVRAEVVLVPAGAILTATGEQEWDVALPSVATWRIDAARFLVSSPYYEWSRRLVVLDSSTATSRSDVLGSPICAVAGDDGEAWLRGESGATVSPPVTADIVAAADDQACLELLAAGDVAALVTARLSDADLQIRADIRVIGGPEPEARAVIVPSDGGSGDPTALFDAIDAALVAMREDGTLTRLSHNRFGGIDLTTP